MIEPTTSVTEDELHAYADGELPDDRRAAVIDWLATHPEDAARVASWRAIADAITTRYGGVADEPVPERLALDRLAAPLRRWGAMAAAAVLAAFVAGGGIGWFAHALTSGPALARSFTADALEAHKLYVVEVRHPVEVAASERAHLVQWLSKRLGYSVPAPELETAGLKFIGGRLLPGTAGAAAFLMYETASGERFTLYCAKATVTADKAVRFTSQGNAAALTWADDGISYVLAGPGDRERLQKVANIVYDQVENAGHVTR